MVRRVIGLTSLDLIATLRDDLPSQWVTPTIGLASGCGGGHMDRSTLGRPEDARTERSVEAS